MQMAHQLSGFGRCQVKGGINYCFVAVDVMYSQGKLLRWIQNFS